MRYSLNSVSCCCTPATLGVGPVSASYSHAGAGLSLLLVRELAAVQPCRLGLNPGQEIACAQLICILFLLHLHQGEGQVGWGLRKGTTRRCSYLNVELHGVLQAALPDVVLTHLGKLVVVGDEVCHDGLFIRVVHDVCARAVSHHGCRRGQGSGIYPRRRAAVPGLARVRRSQRHAPSCSVRCWGPKR